MRRGQSPLLPVFRALALLGLGAAWAVACGGPQVPGAAGSVCFRTEDCKDGLACVPSAKGSAKSICSNDLSGIVSMVDGAPLEAAVLIPQGDAAGGASGSATTAYGGSPASTGGTGNSAAAAGASVTSGAGGEPADAGNG